jgi:hypothetical protein
LKGVRYSHPAPTAAIALLGSGIVTEYATNDLHDDDPVKDVRQDESYRGHA